MSVEILTIVTRTVAVTAYWKSSKNYP